MERVFSDSVKWPSELGIGISAAVEAVLKKGMAISWKERYQSVSELRKALEVAGKEPQKITTTQAKCIAPTVAVDSNKALTVLVSETLAMENAKQSDSVHQITSGSTGAYAVTVAVIDESDPKTSEITPQANRGVQKKTKKKVKNSYVKKEPTLKKSKVDKKRSSGVSKKIKATVVAFVLIIAFIIVAVILGAKKGTLSNQEIDTPTRITMMRDANKLLEDACVSGVVSGINVTKDSYNEKFGVYRAECEIMVADQPEEYSVVLIYDNVDGSWELNALSKLNQ